MSDWEVVVLSNNNVIALPYNDVVAILDEEVVALPDKEVAALAEEYVVTLPEGVEDEYDEDAVAASGESVVAIWVNVVWILTDCVVTNADVTGIWAVVGLTTIGRKFRRIESVFWKVILHATYKYLLLTI